jgi:hypothetical protein
MIVEPSGVVFLGECELQLPPCTARTPAPVTAVWVPPGRRQTNVCRACLDDMVRSGDWEIHGARVPERFDVAGYDAEGRRLLIVEVRARPSEMATTPRDWAVRIHRNLLLHSALPPARYFLLAICPRPFFLWTDQAVASPDSEPDFEFDPHLRAHRNGKVGLNNMEDQRDCERTVAEWLSKLLTRDHRVETLPSWLRDSGLYQTLKGGRIEAEAFRRFRPAGDPLRQLS